MRIALDLEEVLADTIRESCRSTDKLTESDFDSWNLSDRTWQIYSGVSDALWRHDPTSIPPIEPAINESTYELHKNADRLDIVTARMHVDPQIREWLASNHVYYDDLVSTLEPKYTLDYDVFIDDNPEMFGEHRLLLRDHPHNRNVNDENSKSCDRIHSLAEAREFINE